MNLVKVRKSQDWVVRREVVTDTADSDSYRLPLQNVAHKTVQQKSTTGLTRYTEGVGSCYARTRQSSDRRNALQRVAKDKPPFQPCDAVVAGYQMKVRRV